MHDDDDNVDDDDDVDEDIMNKKEIPQRRFLSAPWQPFTPPPTCHPST